MSGKKKKQIMYQCMGGSKQKQKKKRVEKFGVVINELFILVCFLGQWESRPAKQCVSKKEKETNRILSNLFLPLFLLPIKKTTKQKTMIIETIEKTYFKMHARKQRQKLWNSEGKKTLNINHSQHQYQYRHRHRYLHQHHHHQ